MHSLDVERCLWLTSQWRELRGQLPGRERYPSPVVDVHPSGVVAGYFVAD